jgi:hypothetical protein
MGNLTKYLRTRFELDFRAEFPPKTVSIGTSATQIVKGNPDRVMLAFFNLGSNTVYLHTDSTVSSTKGMYLDANGGHIVLIAEEDGDLLTYEWWGIAAATNNIYILGVEAK